jgi:hypothetical protein
MFLSNIQMREESKTNLQSKHMVKKINLTRQKTKLEDLVKELVSYTKEEFIHDAQTYLSNLSNIKEDQETLKNSKKELNANKFLIELEEVDGLKLIKLDSIRKSVSYY